MLARHFLIAVMTLAILPSPQVPSGQMHSLRPLLNTVPLSDEINVDVIELFEGVGTQPPMLVVQLGRLSTRSGESSPHPQPLSGMAIQVWLLRADGTSVAQRQRWSIVAPAMAGVMTDTTSVFFDDVPRQDVAGGVVSIDGKLYVREIKANPAP